ncbi:hypothetical protein ACQ86E_18550 [Bradyrhizobium betae]|uniref:hypothetical protein n=1 Tax=Bradyrhizobium betae TaxID=244734 RepID=UPI003D668E4C
MTRILVFPLLMPQFALLVFVAPSILEKGLPEAGFWLFAEQFAYFIVFIPACFAAAVDGVLCKQRRYLRLVITACATGVFALVWAHYLGERPSMHDASVGAIPAALCSWISALSEHKTA